MAQIDYANDNLVVVRADGTMARVPATGLTGKAPVSHVGAGGDAHAVATTEAAGFMAAADKALLGSALQPGAFGLGQPYAAGSSPLLADIDAVTTASGLYRATNTTAGVFPIAAIACFVLVERYSGSWIKQTLTYRGDYAAGYGKTYVRTYNSTAWRPWQRLAFVDTLATDLLALATDLTAS